MQNSLERPDGTTVYEISGEGPPLFLLTGLGGSRGYWANLVPGLSRHFSVVLHDHMGTGQSQSRRSVHTVDALTDDALALMDHLGIQKAHFLGHSTGAAVGQIIAQNRPERIEKLVLYAGWAGPDPHFTLCFEIRKMLLMASGIPAYHRASPLFLYPPRWISESIEQLETLLANAIANSPPANVLAARIDMLLAFDRRNRMHEISTPTLIVCAEDDQLTPMHLSEELADGISGATLARMSWGGHAASQTRSAEFQSILLDFLR
jgi:aminoacrylate hydrolase